MKPKLLLRLAALVILIHILGHLMGHSTWKTPQDPARQEVVNMMLEQKSPFMGAIRSLGDYYEGYSNIITVTLVTLMVILWLLSGVSTESTKISKIVLIPIALCLLTFSVFEFIYFFPFAASISLMAGLLIGISVWRLEK